MARLSQLDFFSIVIPSLAGNGATPRAEESAFDSTGMPYIVPKLTDFSPAALDSVVRDFCLHSGRSRKRLSEKIGRISAIAGWRARAAFSPNSMNFG
jgi:hypothetical protein